MVEKNILSGKSKTKIEEILVSDLKSLGASKFDISISPQAKAIISNYGSKFPYQKFKSWFIKTKMCVNGGHLHEYLATQFEKDI